MFRALSESVREIFARSEGAVVKIEGTDRHGKLSGTGFFIEPSGMLYTSYTIGGTANDLMVIKGDMRYPAKRLIGDSRSGIAILKIEAETPFLAAGTSQSLEATTPVLLVGYPLDLPLSPSFGLVAGMDPGYEGLLFRTTHIRANLPVHRGEAGAPILDMNGDVVGILISAIDSGANGCFALPIDAAEKVRRDFVRFGELRPGWLGVTVETRDSDSGSTACVTQVTKGGPSDLGGIQPGDMLMRIGNTEIRSPRDILDASFFLTAGDPVAVVVHRSGEKIELGATPTSAPETTGDPLQLEITREESGTDLGDSRPITLK